MAELGLDLRALTSLVLFSLIFPPPLCLIYSPCLVSVVLLLIRIQ